VSASSWSDSLADGLPMMHVLGGSTSHLGKIHRYIYIYIYIYIGLSYACFNLSFITKGGKTTHFLNTPAHSSAVHAASVL
jgi:uncharacterized membrane protein